MRVGIYLPTWTNGLLDGEQPRWSDLASTAARLDAAGFNAIWLADQFLQTFPDHPRLAFWESWTMATAVAGVTRRATVGPLVASASFRNPAILAEMAVALDEVSGGRAAIGLGAGYDAVEHRAHGLPTDGRIGRLEAAAAILDDLLRRGRSDRPGGPWETNALDLEPRGPRPGRLPLLIGTYTPGPRTLAIVARHADAWAAWLAFDDNRPAAMAATRLALDTACEAIGRDPATLAAIAGIAVHATAEPFRFGPYDLSRIAIGGDAFAIAGAIEGFRDAGVNEVAMYTFPLTPAAIDVLARARELVAAG